MTLVRAPPAAPTLRPHATLNLKIAVSMCGDENSANGAWVTRRCSGGSNAALKLPISQVRQTRNVDVHVNIHVESHPVGANTPQNTHTNVQFKVQKKKKKKYPSSCFCAKTNKCCRNYFLLVAS